MIKKLAQATIDIQEIASQHNIPGADIADPQKGFALLIGKMMQAAMTLAALAVLAYLIWGGIEWITSGGDKSKVENARNRITQAIMGIIVLAATTAIFMLVQNFLGITVLNFSGGSTQSSGSGSAGSGSSSSENRPCKCWNGKGYAAIGEIGMYSLSENADCYECKASGWKYVGKKSEVKNCGVISCTK